jgi:DNA-binding HxlR family transcriptional regulator
MSRSYGQYCGLARALDVIGDRWNLLIVRQLLLGPARYRDLMDGLPGVATNLLSDRLHDLEAVGVVERRPVPQGNAVAYALTDWGRQLRGTIEELVRWSTPLMVSGPGTDVFRPEWLAVALPALLKARVDPETSVAVGVTVDGQTFRLGVARGSIDVSVHTGAELDAGIRADGMVVLGMASGMLDLADVRSMVELRGEEADVRAAFGMRPAPAV